MAAHTYKNVILFFQIFIYSLSSYKISVQSGDRIGDETDVSIRLHGQETKTDTYDLNNLSKNAGNTGTFYVTSEINIPKVQKIELWRDNRGWSSNWYLECIAVRNQSSQMTTIFPVMKWIKEGPHYFFKPIDTCLPQNEQCKNQRMEELTTMQNEYQLEVKIPGLPAQVYACISRNSLKIMNDTRLWLKKRMSTN